MNIPLITRIILSVLVLILYSCKPEGYKNSVDQQKKGYTGPLFELQYDYPKDTSSFKKSDTPWLDIPVNFTRPDSGTNLWSKEWKDYADCVKEYLKDNITFTDIDLQVNKDWYNIPWLAENEYTGREYTHGARYSFSIPSTQLLPNEETRSLPIWAMAYFNKYGAYSIGKMWSEDAELLTIGNGANENLRGLPFLDGTVIFKINIIGNLKGQQPKHFNNAPQWTFNMHTINPSEGKSLERSLQPGSIFEVDFMVKDSRSESGWVFGALAYDDSLSSENNIWDRFRYIGIQFGNDPESYPAVSSDSSKSIYQSIRTDYSVDWNTGCSGRLATFAGTVQQNCVGCHQPASYGVESSGQAQRGFGLSYPGVCNSPIDSNNSDFRYYFKNGRYPTKYTGPPEVSNPISIDFSLRSFDAIKAYFKHKSKVDSLRQL